MSPYEDGKRAQIHGLARSANPHDVGQSCDEWDRGFIDAELAELRAARAAMKPHVTLSHLPTAIAVLIGQIERASKPEPTIDACLRVLASHGYRVTLEAR